MQKYILLLMILSGLAAFSTAIAAPVCDPWRKLANGNWYLHCMDDRGKNICYICPNQQVTAACTKREGASCAS